MENKIMYAKYPFPALLTGDYEYEPGKAMYSEEDMGYCSGILPDGSPFVSEHYHSKTENMDYLIIVLPVGEILDFKISEDDRHRIFLHPCFNAVLQMEIDDMYGDLLNTAYKEKINKYLVNQGVISDGSIKCDCLYLAKDRNDSFIVVGNYKMPDFSKCNLLMKEYGEKGKPSKRKWMVM